MSLELISLQPHRGRKKNQVCVFAVGSALGVGARIAWTRRSSGRTGELWHPKGVEKSKKMRILRVFACEQAEVVLL